MKILPALYKNDKLLLSEISEESKDQDIALSGKTLSNPIPNMKHWNNKKDVMGG